MNELQHCYQDRSESEQPTEAESLSGENNGQSAVEPIQSEWCTDGLRQINKWRDGAKNSVWGKTVDGVTDDINVDVVHGAFNIFGANNSVL